jgi:hypothetical protein
MEKISSNNLLSDKLVLSGIHPLLMMELFQILFVVMKTKININK